MQIAGDQFGLEFVQRAQVIDRAQEGLECRKSFQIADVLTEEYMTADSDRYRVLQMRAQRQHLTQRCRTITGKGA